MKRSREARTKLSTIDKILLGCAIFIILFTISMIVIFCVYQAVPDSLIEATFSLFSAEAVVTMVIWWLKRKDKRNGRKDETDES